MTFRRTSSAALLAAAALLSCNYVHMERTFRAEPGDWQMYGGGTGRCNVSPEEVRPPLRKLWEYTTGAGFSSAPASAVDSILFVGTLIGEVHTIRLATGEGMGTTDFGSAIVGTPIPDGDDLYISLTHDETSMLAYNLRSGRTEWKVYAGDIESSPLLMGEKLLVTTLEGRLIALNKATGVTLWTFDAGTPEHPVMIHSSPSSDGTRIFFGADDGFLYAVKAADGTGEWKGATAGPLTASPSVSDGCVYIGSTDRTLYAFDAATGAPRWKRGLGSGIVASQAVDGEHVYAGTTGGVFFCLNKKDGSVVWSDTAGSLYSAPPLVSGQVVYAGCADRTLYAFDAGSGARLWEFKTEGRIKSMPIIWRRLLVVLAEDDVVMGFARGEEK
jgi:outer membrane protein assembly factor BamB